MKTMLGCVYITNKVKLTNGLQRVREHQINDGVAVFIPLIDAIATSLN